MNSKKILGLAAIIAVSAYSFGANALEARTAYIWGLVHSDQISAEYVHDHASFYQGEAVKIDANAISLFSSLNAAGKRAKICSTLSGTFCKISSSDARFTEIGKMLSNLQSSLDFHSSNNLGGAINHELIKDLTDTLSSAQNTYNTIIVKGELTSAEIAKISTAGRYLANEFRKINEAI